MTTSRSITNAIGFAFVVAGLPPLTLALGWLTVPSESLPVPLWALGCGGAALAFAGLSLLVPESLSRPRGLLASLSITALATLFDWVAFGRVQGGWRFLLDSLVNALALRQNAALDVVVLFAVLLTLLALWSWMQWVRHMAERDAGTPLQNAGRKRKVKEGAE
jgi:hypothetical protein